MLKRTLEMVVAVAMMTIPLTVSAQKNSDPEGFVTYSLPSTVITLEVEAVQEKFHAGPYARFAEKYLGIKARQKDETSVRPIIPEKRGERLILFLMISCVV